MKYAFCPNCKDIFGAYAEPQTCFCGESGVLKANAVDTSYVGDAIILSVKKSDLEWMSDETRNESAVIKLWKTPKDDPYMKKSEGKDFGKRWGQMRSKARRRYRLRGTKKGIPVKMEWEVGK